MTNPNNSLGTNGALGGRTSVNAFNDVLATFDGAGIVSGFVVEPDSGMTVAVGGDGTTRDVAVAEDPFGNRTTVDNISGDPINVTISTASTTSARIDSIVAYVNSPAQASDTSVDNPTACGIIAVNGTSGGAPLDSAIRTAITADGGTGSTAYYVVIANVSVPANTTTITSGLISAGKSINLSNVATSGSNGLMSGADKLKLDNGDVISSTEQRIGKWTDGKPLYRKAIQTQTPATQSATTAVATFDSTYNIVNFYGSIKVSASNQVIGLNFYLSSMYAAVTFIDNGAHEIKQNVSTQYYTNQGCTIVIEYTKTTD